MGQQEKNGDGIQSIKDDSEKIQEDEDSQRNFAKRGINTTTCCECGAKTYTLYAYTKGRGFLCKNCKQKKREEMFKSD
jgi:hypothetical protein